MYSFFLRLWFVLTIGWWIASAIWRFGALDNLGGRPWGRALEYGLNNFFCAYDIKPACRQMSVSYSEQGLLNETFMLIVTFAGVPLLALVAALTLGWVTSGLRPSRRR